MHFKVWVKSDTLAHSTKFLVSSISVHSYVLMSSRCFIFHQKAAKRQKQFVVNDVCICLELKTIAMFQARSQKKGVTHVTLIEIFFKTALLDLRSDLYDMTSPIVIFRIFICFKFLGRKRNRLAYRKVRQATKKLRTLKLGERGTGDGD